MKNLTIRIICVARALLLCESSFATITGKVVNAQDKSPITNATVSTKASGALTKTDDRGNFVINANDTTALVTISHIGFVTLCRLRWHSGWP